MLSCMNSSRRPDAMKYTMHTGGAIIRTSWLQYVPNS